jgi:hypothetical protein
VPVVEEILRRGACAAKESLGPWLATLLVTYKATFAEAHKYEPQRENPSHVG